MKILFLFLFLLVFSFSFVSSLSLTDQFGICEDINFSLSTCLMFWGDIENLSLKYNITYDDFIPDSFYIYENVTQNVTEYVNVTQNVTEYVNVSNCSFVSKVDILNDIDSYAVRGFEPIFENGVIVNWRRVNLSSPFVCDMSICDKFCEEKVVEIKKQYESSSVKSDSSDYNLIYYFVFGLIVLAILWFIYQKVSEKSSERSFFSFPQERSLEYRHAPPGFIGEVKKPKGLGDKQEDSGGPDADGF